MDYNLALILALSIFAQAICICDLLKNRETRLLERTFALATLAEMAPNLNMLWFRHKGRTLPYWGWPSNAFGLYMYNHPILNDLLVAILLANLIMITLNSWTIAYLSVLRYNAVFLFALLSAADIQRFVRVHQFIFTLAAFAFSDDCSLQIIIGGVYIYSGLGKLLSPSSFLKDADKTMDGLKQALSFFSSDRRLFLVFAKVCLLSEVLLGFAILIGASRACTIALAFGLHGYIIVFVVIGNNEPSILNWNVFCLTTAIATTIMPGGTIGLPELVISIVFLLYPISLYVGKCAFFELSFSFYNSRNFARGYGVFPLSARHKYTSNWPHLRIFDSESSIEYWEATETGSTPLFANYKELLEYWSDNGVNLDQLALDILGMNNGNLYLETFAVDCDLFCQAYAMNGKDPCAATFSCLLPKAYFDWLARNVLHSTGVYVRTRHCSDFCDLTSQEAIGR